MLFQTKLIFLGFNPTEYSNKYYINKICFHCIIFHKKNKNKKNLESFL